MKTAFCLCAALALACADKEPDVAPIAPFHRTPNELPRLIKSQGYESRLSLDGLAFLDSTLFVTTNIGLLEVEGHVVSRLDQWLKDDNVVSGPWRDDRTKSLWIKRDHDGVFLVWDRAHWRQVSLPPPPDGNFTRGDMLEGFRGVSDSVAFRLVGAGRVWQLSDTSTWTLGERPPTDELNALVGFAVMGSREFHVVSSGGCGYLKCVVQGFWRTAGEWSAPMPIAVGDVAEVLAVRNGTFLRGTKGEILRIDQDSARVISSPGACEAIARTSDGSLVASFRHAGIFVLETGWRKLFEDPSPPADGEHWARLAEYNGRFAFVTTTVPQIDAGSNRTHESGSVGLWVSESGRLVPVKLL